MTFGMFPSGPGPEKGRAGFGWQESGVQEGRTGWRQDGRQDRMEEDWVGLKERGRLVQRERGNSERGDGGQES